MTQDHFRSLSLAGDRWVLAALSVYAQVTVGLSLYLYDAVSTPAYLSVLLCAPALFLLMGAARRGLPGARLPRAVYALPALSCLLDALLSFFTLCAVMADVMPDMDVLAGALVCAAVLALGLGGAPGVALPRLARMMLFTVIPLLFFCAACAFGHGSTAHFFPLLGYGPHAVLRGAGWTLGCLSGAVMPLLCEEDEMVFLSAPRAHGLPILLSALLFGSATAAVSAWLMPAYALSGSRTLGWRMLLITHMTPSVPCWSMEVMAVLLLLLLSLSVSVRQGAQLLGRAMGRRADGWAEALLLLLLSVPAGLQSPGVRSFLSIAAPFRLAGAALPVAAAWLLRKGQKREERP